MSKPVDPRARLRFLFSLALLATAVILIIVVLWISASRTLSTLEQILFQVFVLLASLLGAYLLGLQTKRESEEWALRQYARAAFRRVLTLYRSLNRMAESLSHEDRQEADAATQRTLSGLRATVVEQLDTIHDALEDWRDIIPEDVRDIEARLAKVSRDWGESVCDE
jgi:hypothetical protein